MDTEREGAGKEYRGEERRREKRRERGRQWKVILTLGNNRTPGDIRLHSMLALASHLTAFRFLSE